MGGRFGGTGKKTAFSGDNENSFLANNLADETGLESSTLGSGEFGKTIAPPVSGAGFVGC